MPLFARLNRCRPALLASMLMFVLVAGGCRSVLYMEYEYDEEIYLELDGSATVYVNASVPALVALRGAPLDVDPKARLDRDEVRAFFESPVTQVESVTTSRRDNRRYVHVRLEVSDIRRLSDAAPFAWSTYTLNEKDELAVFRQDVGKPTGHEVGNVGWSGDEMVAFRYHLPSRIPFHNAPSREVERGNIIRWEQPLASRLQGEPLGIEVHMETESILMETLALFALTIVAALATLATAVWFVMRRKGAELPAPSHH